MSRILYALFLALTAVSCSETYSIQGSSSIATLDGSKLYLRTIKNNELKAIDSCDVVHGQFHFNGSIDTTRMCNLCMDDESMLPVVLEQGEITIRIDNMRQNVSGTPLNDALYDFLDHHNRLSNQRQELATKQSQMILEGIDEQTINRQLTVEAAQIAQQEDSLVTNFIVENFDNVLGPGVFMMITSGFQYPVLTPQIEDIMSKATRKFKNDPYVKDYYETATENERRMQGFDTPADVANAQTEQQHADTIQ